MTEPVPRRPPLPLVQAFLPCGEIFQDSRTGRFVLVGPTSHVPVTHFPAHVRLSVFTEFTGGRGIYQTRIVLREETDEVVWGWGPPQPVEEQDPLRTHHVTFHDLVLPVPRPGRYTLALELNGERVAQRWMTFGPAEVFRS